MQDWHNHKSCNGHEQEQEDEQKFSKASLSSVKNELLRYAHFFERYSAHHKAEQFAAVDQSQAMAAVADALTTSVGYSVADVAFISAAVQQIRASRRFLKFTYIYGFFAQFDFSQKKLFEFHQAQLEGTLERLSDVMEHTSWDTYLDNVDSRVPFFNLRTSVIGLTGVVHDFFKKLQEALQEDSLFGSTLPHEASQQDEPRRVPKTKAVKSKRGTKLSM